MWINCNVGTLFTIGFCVRCTKRVTMNVRYHSLFEYWHWVKLKGRIIGEVSFYQNLSSIRFPMFQILNSRSEQWLYRTIDTRLKSTEVNTLEWFSIVYIKRRDEQHNEDINFDVHFAYNRLIEKYLFSTIEKCGNSNC